MILCGFAGNGLSQESREALDEWNAEVLDFTGDDYAYWQALCKRWGSLEPLLVMEQDHILTPKILASFACCREDWCCFSYKYAAPRHIIPLPDASGSTDWAAKAVTVFRQKANTAAEKFVILGGLGCTRFSAGLQRRIGSLDSSARILWDVVDNTLFPVLKAAGYAPHDHGQIPHEHKTFDLCLHPPGDAGTVEWHYVGYPTRYKVGPDWWRDE